MGMVGTGAFNFEHVIEALGKFKMPAEDFKRVSIYKAERLTPDSSAVLLIVKENYYVIYTEDFIQSLDYVKEQIEKWYASKVEVFLEAKVPETFEDSFGSQYYKQPNEDIVKKWMSFAASDVHDYMFLAKILPTEDNESFWADRSMIASELSAEVAALANKHLPPDPSRPFIDEWKDRSKRERPSQKAND